MSSITTFSCEVPDMDSETASNWMYGCPDGSDSASDENIRDSPDNGIPVSDDGPGDSEEIPMRSEFFRGCRSRITCDSFLIFLTSIY